MGCWAEVSMGWWVGGAREQQETDSQVASKCQKEVRKRSCNRFWHLKRFLFETLGVLGGHLGLTGGHFGQPGDDFGQPGRHFEHPGGHFGQPGDRF